MTKRKPQSTVTIMNQRLRLPGGGEETVSNFPTLYGFFCGYIYETKSKSGHDITVWLDSNGYHLRSQDRVNHVRVAWEVIESRLKKDMLKKLFELRNESVSNSTPA